MNHDESINAVAVALAACPAHAARIDKEGARNMAAVWAEMFSDLPAERVLAAIKRHVATSKWLPSVAEIRTIVSEAANGRRRPGGEAWGDVLRAVSRFGFYRAPEFDDPIVEVAVRRLGWRELCSSENQVADRARFVALYDELAARAAEDASVGDLRGAATPALPAGVVPLITSVTKRGG